MVRLTGCLAVLAATACSLTGAGSPAAILPGSQAAHLASQVAGAAAARPVAFRGLRQPDGSSSAVSSALEELLTSELVRVGVTVVPLSSTERDSAAWEAGSLLPEAWGAGPDTLILAGQVRPDGDLSHLRLLLAEGSGGACLWSGHASLATLHLERLARAMAERAAEPAGKAAAAAAPEIALELHVVVRRDEEGFARAMEVEEGGTLRQGDRLQLRFRTGGDFEVYAFLMTSKGEREELVGPELMYAGRLQYAPSAEGFVRLSEPDEVYTLYLLAAQRLDGLDELFDDIDDLLNRAQVERFAGLDQVDAAVLAFLQRRIAGAEAAAVQRGSDGIERGEEERWAYSDGQALTTRPELLRGRGVLVRALSFEVAYP